MKIIITCVFSLTLVVVLASQSITVRAHSGENKNDPRHVAMTTLGQNMKAISRAVKSGNITADLPQKAAEIHKISNGLVALFPKGNELPESRAKPEIWSDSAGFNAANNNFIKAASDLANALKSGDIAASKLALKATGKTCGGCHKAYRLPKK
jgi:cytochrome c556